MHTDWWYIITPRQRIVLVFSIFVQNDVLPNRLCLSSFHRSTPECDMIWPKYSRVWYDMAVISKVLLVFNGGEVKVSLQDKMTGTVLVLKHLPSNYAFRPNTKYSVFGYLSLSRGDFSADIDIFQPPEGGVYLLNILRDVSEGNISPIFTSLRRITA